MQRYTNEMTDTEIIYEAFCIWNDDFLLKALDEAPALMSNPYTRRLIVWAAEVNLGYEDYRRKTITNSEIKQSSLYDSYKHDRPTVRDMMYQMFIRTYQEE